METRGESRAAATSKMEHFVNELCEILLMNFTKKHVDFNLFDFILKADLCNDAFYCTHAWVGPKVLNFSHQIKKVNK